MSTDETKSTLESLAAQRSPSVAGELVQFLRENKKWWLLPIVVVLALAAALVVLSGTGVAPFIYALF